MTGRRLELTAAEARWLLRASMAGVDTGIRAGGRLPTYAAEVLRRLADIADSDPPAWQAVGSVNGTARSSVGDVDRFVPTAAAAASSGVSAEYVRRLARSGRIRHTKVGRAWLVDPESLATVLRRTA